MLVLIGTLLPVIGSIITLILGLTLKKKARWISLFAVPAVTLSICLLFSEELANNGNLLYAALILVYVLVLPIYYIILLAILAVHKIKKAKAYLNSNDFTN